MFKQYQFRNYRIRLVLLVYMLTTIGILVIGSAEKSFQSQQILGLILGSAAMLVCSLTDYNLFVNLHLPIYGFNLLLLILVLTPLGKNVNGAQRWIEIPHLFQLQPSELAKILVILFFARFLSDRTDRINERGTILLSVILFAVPAVLF